MCVAMSDSLSSLNDPDLLKRFCKTRCETAFGELVERYGKLVMSVCLRVLKNQHDAEDAFQATFLVLAEKAGKIKTRDRRSLPSWLCSVAYRLSMNLARKHHRKDLALTAEPVAARDQFSDLEQRFDEQAMDEELQSLPPKYRDVLVRFYFLGQTSRQIAEALEITQGAADGRIKRGRQELRVRLAKRGVALGALTVMALSAQTASAAVAPTLVESTVTAAVAKGSVGLFSTSVVKLAGTELMKATSFVKSSLAVCALIVVAGVCTFGLNAAFARSVSGGLPVNTEITGHAQPFLPEVGVQFETTAALLTAASVRTNQQQKPAPPAAVSKPKADGGTTAESKISQMDETRLMEDVRKLGPFLSRKGQPEFKSVHYIRVARQLMEVSEEDRTRYLKQFCDKYREQVIILCRMLFEARSKQKFRRPLIGFADFVTRDRNWPLEPIAIVDEVPFVIVRGYGGSGIPESAARYLDYCLKNCAWTTRRYKKDDEKSISAALDKLVKSKKSALGEWSLNFLRKQVEHPNQQQKPAPPATVSKPKTDGGTNAENKISKMNETKLMEDFRKLGPFNPRKDKPEFKSAQYIRVARQLLSIPEERRREYLKQLVSGKYDEQAIILCRMLFEARPKQEFRRPFVGGPVFVARDSKWPLEPIAIVDEVPFLIVRGYRLGGQPEPASNYLDYCLKNCAWTTRRYRRDDKQTLSAALEKLVKSQPALGERGRSYLSKQVE